MFRSIVRPVRVFRFSKTASFPQSSSSSIPANRHGFSFEDRQVNHVLAQPLASRTNRTAPVVISKTEQTQRSPRTREPIVCVSLRANSIPYDWVSGGRGDLVKPALSSAAFKVNSVLSKRERDSNSEMLFKTLCFTLFGTSWSA